MATKKKPLYSGAGTTGLGAFDLYGNAKQNKDALLSMQQFLNASNPATKIKEDGIWGSETQGAWDRFNASPSVVAQATTANATMVPDQHDSGNGAIVGIPLSTFPAPTNSGWGFMDASSNDAKNEALYRIGENWGNLSEADQAEAAGKLTGLDTKSLVGSDITKTGNGSGGQWVNGLSNFETLQGVAGLGSLGMNLYGMFGSGGTKEVNKKNIELMDQQIANNRDIMKTRTERAGDIKKYFG